MFRVVEDDDEGYQWDEERDHHPEPKGEEQEWFEDDCARRARDLQ